MLALQLAASASRSSRQPARHPLGTLKNREVLTATPRFFCIEVFIATILLHFIFQLTDLAVTPVLSEKLAAKPYEVSTFVRNVSRDFGQKMHFAL